MSFDPEQFLNTLQEDGVDTRFIPHPADGEYQGYIGTDPKDITFKTTPKGATILEVNVYTEDPAVCEVTSRTPTKVRWSAFLDVNESGGLDLSPGKNRRLGMMLTALGFQNLDGTGARPWKFSDWHGLPLRYTVNLRPADDGTGTMYDEVSRVARVG